MEIILCVTGSIAAIESVKLARELKRQGANVKCFMSDEACHIIHPNAMEFATGEKVVLNLTGEIEHVKYAQADLIIVAPSTANLVSKFAYKIADNPINALLITAFGYKTPILMVPSMHNSMYKAIVENIDKLKSQGINFVKPKIEEGKAKFPEIDDIVLHSLQLMSEGELQGKKVLVTAGGTFEEIDPIRGITNRSSGKMGVEIAKQAFIKGAEVTLVYANVSTEIPKSFKSIKAESANEMYQIITQLVENQHIFISAAAVSDFTIKKGSRDINLKISSDEDLTLKLEPTAKIINAAKVINPEIFLIAFKAEYNLSKEQLIEKASMRLKESNANMIVANDVSNEETGFGSTKNQVIIIDDEITKTSLSSKENIAQIIIERIIKKLS
ncbi:MAG: bifunctional phosphopantothenoylcysteine decarboxylase/phosphopantothenate--cysteine ligase CoaBC [Methanobacteriaceae archaeon]|jgi:phosphopantothenoylcysteine decarboxylase/phosphopantothenate--cysteine ligase|nr:MAG: bifunctional phosphopantothenoylcysteine decarboxylase/phosphopantothenate--cysteine ligase CoaBC [Methanobacterium sp. BRmetb2]MCC7557390.1 bifunctional phosphopantothenoylcysteine decarboxylase/phosphopantothenate--cysteine ligase CoaBC [Methanobacteriaceae archaeon]